MDDAPRGGARAKHTPPMRKPSVLRNLIKSLSSRKTEGPQDAKWKSGHTRSVECLGSVGEEGIIVAGDKEGKLVRSLQVVHSFTDLPDRCCSKGSGEVHMEESNATGAQNVQTDVPDVPPSRLEASPQDLEGSSEYLATNASISDLRTPRSAHISHSNIGPGGIDAIYMPSPSREEVLRRGTCCEAQERAGNQDDSSSKIRDRLASGPNEEPRLALGASPRAAQRSTEALGSDSMLETITDSQRPTTFHQLAEREVTNAELALASTDAAPFVIETKENLRGGAAWTVSHDISADEGRRPGGRWRGIFSKVRASVRTRGRTSSRMGESFVHAFVDGFGSQAHMRRSSSFRDGEPDVDFHSDAQLFSLALQPPQRENSETDTICDRSMRSLLGEADTLLREGSNDARAVKLYRRGS
jgi:hypothetical protein